MSFIKYTVVEEKRKMIKMFREIRVMKEYF